VSKDLATWLRNRLDEDEQTARDAGSVRLNAYLEGGDDGWAVETEDGGDPGAIIGDRGLAEHIARWDPARVLAEVQAKRRMIDHLELAMPRLTPLNNWGAAEMDELAGNMLQLLALPYAAHPDYRAEWSPEWWPYGEGNDA
jgi:hypothetical protein